MIKDNGYICVFLDGDGELELKGLCKRTFFSLQFPGENGGKWGANLKGYQPAKAVPTTRKNGPIAG